MDIFLLSGVIGFATGLGWLVLALLVFPVMPMDNPRIRPVAIVLSTLASLKNIFAGVFVIYQGVVLGVSAGIHTAAVALVSLNAAYMVAVLFAAVVGLVKWRRRPNGDDERMGRLEEKQERDLTISENTRDMVSGMQDEQQKVLKDLGEQKEHVRNDLDEERKRSEEEES